MQGKVVVITGASRGIGAAAVRQFAAAGARVAALARSGSAIEALAGQIGAQVMPIVCDVSSWPQTSAAMEAVSAKWGRIDVLVNNAGQIEPIARIADAAPQDWAQAVQVNLAGAFHAIRAVLPHMKAAGGGTIINVSSGAATFTDSKVISSTPGRSATSGVKSCVSAKSMTVKDLPRSSRPASERISAAVI